MIPWIQVYSNLTSHRKTGRLADELGLTNNFVSPDVVAVGILISLWTWAIQNASNGDLSDCSARIIAEACRWRKKPEQLIAALKSSGWMDEDGRLHDWEEYTCLLMEQEDNRKAKTRERVQRYRDKKRTEMESRICQYCGAEATGYDHILATARGGSDDDKNKVPCCAECNNFKTTLPVVDFLNRNRKRINDDIVTSNAKLAKFIRLDAESNRYVTVTCNESNAPTRHNITIPDITEQDNNKSIYLSEERKEEKKEAPQRDNSAWHDPNTWVKMARMAKEFGWKEQLADYIARAREAGAIIDPDTLEVSYE